MATTTQNKVKKTASKVAKSAASAAKKTGQVIVKNPQTTLYVVLGIAAVYVGYKLYKTVKSATDGITDDPNAGGGNVDDLNNPGGIPIGATISLTAAQILAADILSAVDSAGGLNENEYKVVENALRNKNAYDYQLISAAFGTPRRSPITGEESVWYLFGEKLNLTQWLTIELNLEQKTRLHKAAPLIWPAP